MFEIDDRDQIDATGDLLDALSDRLDALAGEDLVDVDRLRLRREVDRFGGLVARLEAEALRRAGEWERRRLWMLDGSRSARACLSRAWGLTVGAAGERLEVAARLHDTPAVADAFASGRLSYPKVRELCAGVAEDLPESARATFGESEAPLVEAAESLPVHQVREVMRFLRAHVDPDGESRHADSKYDRRGLSVSTTFEGMVAIDGLLDPEAGQIVRRALATLESRLWRDDHHTPSGLHDDAGCEPDPAPRTDRQRRADALVELCRLADANAGQTPDRPRIAAIIDQDALEGRPGRAMWADSHEPLPAATAQRLACDSTITGITLDDRLVPLAVTHGKGQVSPGLRAALVIRDGGCAAPGCTIPAEFCDVHHLTPRAEGGLHSIDNCALFCRHHHRHHHEHRWRTAIDAHTGRPKTRTPDTEWTPTDPAPLQRATLAHNLAVTGRPGYSVSR